MIRFSIRISGIQRGALAAVIAAAVLPSAPAFAVLPSSAQQAISGTASPGRVEKQFEQQGVTSESAAPKVEVTNPPRQQVPEGAENIKFKLASVQIEGVSAYNDTELKTVYADKLGQTISLANLYAISESLTRKYRNEGYILTQVVVPPQTIDGGNVKLRVVEGYIDRVSVEGEDQESALSLIKKYAVKLRTGQALNVGDLERYLLLINDLPGVEARSVLSPSKTMTGAADLRIIVSRDPYDAFLGADNFGSRYLGPLQLSAAGSSNSVFGYNERLSAQVVAAPHGNELGYVSVAYEQPVSVFGDGTNLALTASDSRTEPGYDLSPFDVRGRSQYLSVEVNHAFIRSRAENLFGHVKFDWRNVESRDNVEPKRKDRIRALRAGGRFEFLDRLFGVGINTLDVEVAQGIDVMDSSDKGDANLSRTLGDPLFSKLSVDAQRLQRITPSLNLLAAVQGQWASAPLLSSEEFGIGGVNIGRGYDPSEIVGDEGIAGKIELQWNSPYPWWDVIENYQLFSFFDAGTIWNKDPSATSEEQETLTSAGLGLRMDFQKGVQGGVAVAFPLDHDVQTQGGDRNPKVYLNFSRTF